jgi:hypothetical protein
MLSMARRTVEVNDFVNVKEKMSQWDIYCSGHDSVCIAITELDPRPLYANPRHG